jgi:hypothetical protein
MYKKLIIGSFVALLAVAAVRVFVAPAGAPQAPLGLLPAPGSTRNVPTCDLTGTWTRDVIYDGISGNDGLAMNSTVEPGALHLASVWEQAGDVTLSRSADGGLTWATIVLDNDFPSVEGTAWGDFDMDGQDDICATSQTGDVNIYFAPTLDADLDDPVAWTKMAVTVADKASQEGWMACAAGDIDNDGHTDLVLGGTTLITTGVIAYAVAPAAGKRTDGNWTTLTELRDSGRTMSLYVVDTDGDGDDDLIGSTRFTPNVGTWKAVNDGSGGMTFSDISTSIASTQVLMMFTPGDIDTDGTLDVCNGSDGGTAIRCHQNLGSGWLRFIPTVIRYPANVGAYQSSTIGDLDDDDYPDLILTFSAATTGLSGMVALRGPLWRERIEIAGANAFTSKFDNAVLLPRSDGFPDVIAGDQGDEDGVQENDEGLSVWRNPCH